MNIYRPRTKMEDDGNCSYCRFDVSTRDERRTLNEAFRGKPFSLSEWKPFHIVRSPSEKFNLTAPLGDRAGIDYKLDPMVLSRRALEVLMPHIGPYGQALPLVCDEGEYGLFNITYVIDALDEQKSELTHFPDGALSGIVRYHFKPELVQDAWIFKIPQARGNFSFVTDRFVELVHQAGLTGFAFEKLWSDEG